MDIRELGDQLETIRIAGYGLCLDGYHSTDSGNLPDAMAQKAAAKILTEFESLCSAFETAERERDAGIRAGIEKLDKVCERLTRADERTEFLEAQVKALREALEKTADEGGVCLQSVLFNKNCLGSGYVHGACKACHSATIDALLAEKPTEKGGRE